MLQCGFLSIFAPIENPEKIGEFTGFGLLIGENKSNSMGLEVIFQEIQVFISLQNIFFYNLEMEE